MKTFVVVLFASVAPLLAVTGASALAAEASHAPEVTLDELKKLVATNEATIIDANGVDMYKNGHIPGAVHFAQVQDNLKAVLPADKSKLIVGYCGGPMCTAWQDAEKAVKALGYTNIKHFKAGISGWKKAGEKVEKS